MSPELSYLPQGWVDERLGDLVSFGGGYGFSECFQGRKDGDYPFYKVSDMSLPGNERYLTVANNYVLKQVAKQNGWAPFPVGSVVFAKVGAALLLNRRRVLAQESLIDNNMMAAIPVAIDEDFLYWWFQSVDFSIFVQPGAVPSVNQNQLSLLPVCLPTAYEQRRIAEILDTLDDAIQKTEQLINKLKKIKQGLLHDLLTRGIDENGQLRDPIAHPEQFKESVLGRIPREWDVPRIADIAIHVGSGVTPRGGSDVYKTEGVLFVRSQNVHFDGLRLDDVAYIDRRTHEQMSRSEIFPHDVLINITGASIGRCCAFPDGLGVANVNQHVCAIRTEAPNKDDAKFLSSVLFSHFGQSQIERLNAGGNREGLNYEQLRSFVIPWPTQEERQRIAEILFSQDKRLSDEDSYLRKLALMKNGLMRDLLTGRVRTIQGE